MITAVFGFLAFVAIVDGCYEGFKLRDYRRAISLLVAAAICIGIAIVSHR